jgi:hypothetical protein
LREGWVLILLHIASRRPPLLPLPLLSQRELTIVLLLAAGGGLPSYQPMTARSCE